MSTKNYDSSHYTRKQQAKVLGGYARALQNQIDSPNGQFVVRSTQPTTQSAVIVTYQNLGKCYCFSNFDDQYTYNVKGAAGCGCGAGS
jgi:hypothetical protein